MPDLLLIDGIFNIQMNFVYRDSQYLPVPIQQCILTTQVSDQPFGYNHPNWYLQPNVYPMHASGTYPTTIFSRQHPNNTEESKPSVMRSPECLWTAEIAKCGSAHSCRGNNKIRNVGRTSLSGQSSWPRTKGQPQGRGSFIPKMSSQRDVDGQKSPVSVAPTDLETSEAISRNEQVLQIRKVSTSTHHNATLQKSSKDAKLAWKMSETSTENASIDDIADQLNKNLTLRCQKSSTFSLEPQSELPADARMCVIFSSSLILITNQFKAYVMYLGLI